MYRQLVRLGVIAALSLCALRPAFAAKKWTPAGLVDESCVHEIPNGALIDFGTGDVMMNGVRIGHQDKCQSTMDFGKAPEKSLGTLSSWAAWSEANATTIAGLTQFNALESKWTVPANPAAGSSSTVLWIFNSFITGHNTCATCGVIQPAIDWGYNGQYWEMAVWIVWGCDANGNNCGVGHSPPVQVSAGDIIDGYIDQSASTANGDTFYMEIYNYRNGNYSYGYVGIPPTWVKFATANAGVFEVRGLTSCNQLPTFSSSLTFTMEELYEAGPAWNTFNNVLPPSPSAPTWFSRSIGGSTPDCGFGASVHTDGSTILSWHN
jgi:hypothetical protein